MCLEQRNVRMAQPAREITRVSHIGIKDVSGQNAPILREGARDQISCGIKILAPGKAYRRFSLDHSGSSLAKK
jgi:hypothetical protein